MEQKPASFQISLSPLQLFVAGIASGLLVLCTIGFFIMLSVYFGGMKRGASGDSYAVVPSDQGQQPSAPSQPSAPAGPVTVSSGHFPALGKSSAPVTVVEFADFRCPFCERYYTDVEKNIVKDYVNTGKVKLYFRSWAFLGPESTAASEAAECANEQGKFWAFYNWMYEHQAPESDLGYYSNDNLIKYAAGVGVNKDKFSQCLTSHKFADAVSQDLNDGRAAGVNGTPTTFVNGASIVGAVPYATVKAAIEQALKK